MAIKTIRFGSIVNALQYDDGDFDSAIETDQPIAAGTPTDPGHVIRLVDVDTILLSSLIVSSDAKVTPVDADLLPLVDSADGNTLKKLSWANVKATLKTYFDTLYTTFGGSARLKGYTVATLPAGVQGDIAYVTNALAPTFLVAVVGGGAVVTPVFYNGTTWVSY